VDRRFEQFIGVFRQVFDMGSCRTLKVIVGFAVYDHLVFCGGGIYIFYLIS